MNHADICDCPECRVERMRACDHAAFYQLDNPFRLLDECPTCGRVLRTITDKQGWIDMAAEMRAENRAYELALLEDREEGGRAG